MEIVCEICKDPNPIYLDNIDFDHMITYWVDHTLDGHVNSHIHSQDTLIRNVK